MFNISKDTLRELLVKGAVTAIVAIPASVIAKTTTKLVNQHLIDPLIAKVSSAIAEAKTITEE